jgi:hypothetical protein
VQTLLSPTPASLKADMNGRQEEANELLCDFDVIVFYFMYPVLSCLVLSCSPLGVICTSCGCPEGFDTHNDVCTNDACECEESDGWLAALF